MSAELGTGKNYNLSNAELYVFTNQLATNMRRDLTSLAEFGVTEAKIASMVTMNETLYNMPNDEMLKADYGNAIEIRNQKRQVIYKTLKNIGVRAKVVFKNNPAKEKSINPTNLAQMSDIDFLNAAHQVQRKALEFIDDLEEEGITEAYLTTLANDIKSFSKLIDDVNDKQIIRTETTQARVQTGNQLYDMVSKYCNYGKAEFEESNPAKYNEYVIYSSTAGNLKAPTGLKFGWYYKKFEWNAVENATSYIFESSEDGVTFTEHPTGIETFFIFTPPIEGYMYYRVRARNANGFGPYSDVLKQAYYEILPAPTNLQLTKVLNTTCDYRLTWDAVPSATQYAVYFCKVPIGDPPAEPWEEANMEPPIYMFTAEQTKRYYLNVMAKSRSQTSPRSINVMVDVV